MLLLRGYEKGDGIYFLGNNFRAVARGRKLYVIFLVCFVSVCVSMCPRILLCGRQLIFMLLCIKLTFFHEGTDSLAEVTDLDADTAGKRCSPIVPLS